MRLKTERLWGEERDAWLRKEAELKEEREAWRRKKELQEGERGEREESASY